ncbi:MAG: hypothetical protein ACE5GX_07090, partial [Thermoanaerobaculia bacterium]
MSQATSHGASELNSCGTAIPTVRTSGTADLSVPIKWRSGTPGSNPVSGCNNPEACACTREVT